MKTSLLISIHAILWIGFGIAFALYGPLMMAFFQVPESGITSGDYWQMTAFARMFGAALFGFGMVLWSIRNVTVQLEPVPRRGVLMALLLANLMGFVVAITEQSSIWWTPAGWIATGIFMVLLLAYLALLFALRKESHAQ